MKTLFQSYHIIWLLITCTPCWSSGDGVLQFLKNLPSPTTQATGAGLVLDPLSSFGFYYGIKPDELLTKTRKRDQVILDENAHIERENDFATIGTDVEKWAEDIIAEPNDAEGWVEVHCSKILRDKFNAHGQTQQFIKWMKDSRGEHANSKDVKEHPCMKLTSIIDAPMELVCLYLSQEHRSREYNSLLVDQRDLEVLASNSKICWGQSRKLLFIQPRNFVTFCHHRWLRDGTQLVVNQACSHSEFDEEVGGYWAFSLRGANYISRDPNDPDHKTRIVMLSHANVGNDLPHWAVNTAVNLLAPIKPFEIMYRINVGVNRARPQLEQQLKDRKNRKGRPAGLAQMVYGCFWPEGGGLEDE